MYRTKVEVIDAVTAAELVGTTLVNSSDAGCPFPTDPIATYHLKGISTLNNLQSCIKYFSIFSYDTNILTMFSYSKRLIQNT